MEMAQLRKETKASYWLARHIKSPRASRRVAIDLGLNIGSFPLVFGKHFGEILAVDASSSCLVSAKENLRKLKQVKYVHAALAGQSGKQVALRRIYVENRWDSKDLTTTEFDEVTSRETGYRGVPGEVEETVETLSFSDLLEKHDLGRVDFLKVDIEGAEFETFIDADISKVQALVMEVHYSFLGQEKVRLLVGHLLEELEFVDSVDRRLFLECWPPPDLLIMRRPGAQPWVSEALLSGRIFVTRLRRHSRKLLSRTILNK